MLKKLILNIIIKMQYYIDSGIIIKRNLKDFMGGEWKESRETKMNFYLL